MEMVRFVFNVLKLFLLLNERISSWCRMVLFNQFKRLHHSIEHEHIIINRIINNEEPTIVLFAKIASSMTQTWLIIREGSETHAPPPAAREQWPRGSAHLGAALRRPQCGAPAYPQSRSDAAEHAEADSKHDAGDREGTWSERLRFVAPRDLGPRH